MGGSGQRLEGRLEGEKVWKKGSCKKKDWTRKEKTQNVTLQSGPRDPIPGGKKGSTGEQRQVLHFQITRRVLSQRKEKSTLWVNESAKTWVLGLG